ncbi:two-component system chemotaxis response regulator CheB [Pedobacter sp. UYEF25]
MKGREATNIITIGASAGGLAAVSNLLSSLSEDIEAAIFIVIHLSKNAVTENVLNLLNRSSKLTVEIPENGTKIETGKVYLAPADKHMMLDSGLIRVTKGPKENHWRPSIDVLFRTAAANYGSCVTGLILTGLLDDGTSGMIAIKKSGGVCIVQEPKEAEFPDMPQSVINNIEVDYRVPIVDMGYILLDLYTRTRCKVSEIPQQIQLESDITLSMGSRYDETSELGAPTALTCPDCGGIMTKIEEHGIYRYRCFTGHTFSEHFLENEYANKVEETLWVALRMMEERRNFLLSLENTSHTSIALAADRKERMQEITIHVDRLKEVLKNIENSKKLNH